MAANCAKHALVRDQAVNNRRHVSQDVMVEPFIRVFVITAPRSDFLSQRAVDVT